MDGRKEAERQLSLRERGCDVVIPREGLLDKLERSAKTGMPLRADRACGRTARRHSLDLAGYIENEI